MPVLKIAKLPCTKFTSIELFHVIKLYKSPLVSKIYVKLALPSLFAFLAAGILGMLLLNDRTTDQSVKAILIDELNTHCLISEIKNFSRG